MRDAYAARGLPATARIERIDERGARIESTREDS
jgi:hypothetical protein